MEKSITIHFSQAEELKTEEKKSKAKIESELEELRKTLEVKDAAYSQVNDIVQSLKHRIQDAGGDELRNLKKQLGERDADIVKADRALKKLELDVQNWQKQIDEKAPQIERIEEEKEEHDKKIEELSKERLEFDDKAMLIFDEQTRYQEICTEKKAELDAINEAVEKMKEENNKGGDRVADLVNEADEADKDVQVKRLSNAAIESELRKIRAEHAELPEVMDMNGGDDVAVEERQGGEEEKKQAEAEAGGDVEVGAGLNGLLRVGDDWNKSLTKEGEGAESLQEGGENEANRPSSLKKSKVPTCPIHNDLQPDFLDTLGMNEVAAAILRAEGAINKIPKFNLDDIKHYNEQVMKYRQKRRIFEDIDNRRKLNIYTLEILKKERLDRFMLGFDDISMKLKEMYQMITLGGDAELELIDPLDPFTMGINFSVRPPAKSWRQITNLSGGEKTLASLAMIFALHQYRPTPLYFMDEIDAALDFRNVAIIANYIKQMTKNAQFIIISLRNHMFELANLLVGVFKQHDISKNVSCNPDKVVENWRTKSQKRAAITPINLTKLQDC